MNHKRLLRSLICPLVVLSLVVPLTTAVVMASPAAEIWDWYDLQAIRDNLEGNYVLRNNLDSTTFGYGDLASETANGGKGWEPIGDSDDRFVGTLDGQGHEVSGLYIHRPDEDRVGLFGCVGEGGVIENLGVVNIAVTGDWSVGGLVGFTDEGTISDSYCTGVVNGSLFVGGLVGTKWFGPVSNCHFSGSVTGEQYVGGLIGEIWFSQVSNCHSTGNVTGIGGVEFSFSLTTGGLVGWNDAGTISSSFSTSSVTGDWGVGGLVGGNPTGTVGSSYSTGTVAGKWRVGGLIGYNDGDVSDSYSMSSVTGEWLVGGLVGLNLGSVRNSCANGYVTGDWGVGGLVGESDHGTIDKSYSTSNVTGERYAGGLVGYNWHSTVNNSFWDVEASGMETSRGGTGKTTEEMQHMATFTETAREGLDDPWDIASVSAGQTDDNFTWNVLDGETYPLLSWAICELSISSTVGGRVVRPGEGKFAYIRGTTVDLEAEPENGYRFVHWTEDVDIVADIKALETTIVVYDDYSLMASFIAQYDLTIESTSRGSVTVPGEGTFTYDAGTLVDLVTTPDAGYVVKWVGDVNTVADMNATETTVRMWDDYTIVADFRRPINWFLIGGVVAAISMGLVFFLARRRRRRTV